MGGLVAPNPPIAGSKSERANESDVKDEPKSVHQADRLVDRGWVHKVRFALGPTVLAGVRE